MLLSRGAAVPTDRRVLFVGGKGGVGKTSVASGIALARAEEGSRVLLVSTDPAHNLGHLWERAVGDDPTPLALAAKGPGHVHGVEIDPERTAENHLAAVRETMLRLLPERMHKAAERHLELAREAPGTHESATLDRIAECVETGLADYDLVVFDTAPTGHTLRLLALPERLASWTEALLANRDRSARFGAAVRGLGGGADPAESDPDAQLRRVLIRRRQRFGTLRDLVTDHSRTSFVIVLTAERLPVAESTELHRQLCALGVDVGALVVNRRSPEDAGELLAERRRLEDAQLAGLRADVPGVPLVEVPLLPGQLTGKSGVAAMSSALVTAD